MRAYPRHIERRAQSLDGAWDFAWLGDKAVVASIVPSAIRFDETAAVPGVFDTAPGREGVRGVGVYRKKVRFPAEKGSELLLKFGGMGLFARIWWDGAHVADYQTPYSGAEHVVMADGQIWHELVVAVDNRFDKNTTPLFSPEFDFYGYGGIYRSVEIQELPPLRVERVRVSTLDLAAGRVRLDIRLGGEIPDELEFSVAFDQGRKTSFREKPIDGRITLDANVPDFRTWSPESPALHTVEVEVGKDRIEERFGIRTIEARDRDILLNGRKIVLLGVNRHEAHPESGPVQTTHLMLDDLAAMRELGCNFVRGAHYPQDQEFLDLCDQAGMLVWSESLGWGCQKEDVANPHFQRLQVEQTRRMVADGANHPSVIIWAFMNEACSDIPETRGLFESLAAAVREEDSTRLLSFASNRRGRDLCLDLADVVSMNFYPGWIEEEVNDWTSPPVSFIEGCLDREAAEIGERPELRSKPMLVGEIGACGLYGCRDRAMAQWSEEFQAAYMGEACRCVLKNPRFSGLALWQMFDTRSYVNAGWVRSKPRGFNCAGLLDEYRRPKLAYDTVRKIYQGRRKAAPTI